MHPVAPCRCVLSTWALDENESRAFLQGVQEVFQSLQEKLRRHLDSFQNNALRTCFYIHPSSAEQQVRAFSYNRCVPYLYKRQVPARQDTSPPHVARASVGAGGSTEREKDKGSDMEEEEGTTATAESDVASSRIGQPRVTDVAGWACDRTWMSHAKTATDRRMKIA